MASNESNCTKKSKLDSDPTRIKTDDTFEPGFIVIDLETDGLISRTKISTKIPQILQLGFAALEKLAQKDNTVSFYVQPVDLKALQTKLKTCEYLQKFYISYSEGSYFIKRGGELGIRIGAIPVYDCVNRFIMWKQELYKDRPVYLIAHNAHRFDKTVLEHNLKLLKLFDLFQSQMNIAGWIDSLLVIRRMPNILKVLGYPCATEYDSILQNSPFALTNLVEALSRRYDELLKSNCNLKWPVLCLSHLKRDEQEERWLHHFSRDVMVCTCRVLLRQLTFHQSSDDVMGLVCILHQLNLYPKFRNAHYLRDYDIIIS